MNHLFIVIVPKTDSEKGKNCANSFSNPIYKCKYVDNVAYYRGLIEFSNKCVKDCRYCGIRKSNHKAERFDMAREDVLRMAQWAYEHEYGSLTLQSGERQLWPCGW